MIVAMFYNIGGFEKEDDADPSYIHEDDVIGMYMPIATQLLRSLLGDIKTIITVKDGDEYSSGDLFDDRIISLFAVSFADQDYDKIHVDPETGERRNHHYDQGYMLFLARYGILQEDGELVPPSQVQGYAATSMIKVIMDY